MPLSERQERLYRHRIDLYRPAYDIPPGQSPSDTEYTQAYTDVPCKFRTKSAVDEPMLAGLLESGDLMTVDTVSVAEDQEIETNWIVVNRTLREDGSHGANWGDTWIVRGSPKRVDPILLSHGKTTAYLSRMTLVPDGVAT